VASSSTVPRLSVLLPCRDAAEFLDPCVESLLVQTEARFELLAVDDGSRDETPDRLRTWARRDPRVRVIEGAGLGIVDALRRAVASARGRFLARMDADDVAHPERLATQLELLQMRPALAGCGSRIRFFPRSALGTGYRRYERWLNGLTEAAEIARDLFVECPIAHPTLVVRREAIEAVGGYRAVEWPEDYDLVLRLHAGGFQLANVERSLLDWRVHPGRLSMTSERYTASAFQRCKAHHLVRAFLPQEPEIVIWGAGRVGKGFARRFVEQDGAPPIAAFVDLDPRKIGQIVHGAPVLDPDALMGRLSAATYVLIAVGSPGARAEIRGALDGMGLREIERYRAVA
jgi:glycosyltransferase involved in cell wall biosynthesis